MPKVIVYLPARDQRELEAEGQDPPEWVRQVVKEALDERRRLAAGVPGSPARREPDVGGSRPHPAPAASREIKPDPKGGGR